MTEVRSQVDLAVLREEMTEATRTFVAALNRRGEIAMQIAAAKVASGATQVRDHDRERRVLDFAEEINEGPFSGDAVRRVVQAAMDVSSELQAERFGLPMETEPGAGE